MARVATHDHHPRLGRPRPGAGLAGVLVAVVVVACGGTAVPAEAPSPSQVPSAGSFADLPYRFEMPEGWLFGTSLNLEAYLAEIAKSSPEDARRYEELMSGVPAFKSEFVAYEVGADEDVLPNLYCNTLDRGGTSIAATLYRGESQNVEALSELPGIVERPTSDRITLPVGETVRIRWRTVDPADGADRSFIGYLFISGQMVVTCVFSAGTVTVDGHEPGWESILRTFEVTAAYRQGPSTPAPFVDRHEAPEVEALVPSAVAGRRLSIWSVRGPSVLELWGLSTERADQLRDELAGMGVDLDEVVQVVAGRSDVATDPPYFVMAFHIPAPARDLLGGLAIATAGFTKDTDEWELEERVVGGKVVDVGPTDLLRQSEHQRGRPYLYGSTDLDVSFIVITDDETWAEDAIRQLPS